MIQAATTTCSAVNSSTCSVDSRDRGGLTARTTHIDLRAVSPFGSAEALLSMQGAEAYTGRTPFPECGDFPRLLRKFLISWDLWWAHKDSNLGPADLQSTAKGKGCYGRAGSRRRFARRRDRVRSFSEAAAKLGGTVLTAMERTPT